jgi:hypothetical protein
VPKIQHKPIKRSKLGFKRMEQKKPKRTLVWLTGLSGAPGWINSNLPPLGFWKSHSAIFHQTVRCVCQRSNGSSATVDSNENLKSATVRGQFAQSHSRCQKAHRTVNSTCPVRHRTVRWPRLSELQRLNPNG